MEKENNQRTPPQGLQPSGELASSHKQVVDAEDGPPNANEAGGYSEQPSPPNRPTEQRERGLTRGEVIGLITILVMLIQAGIYYLTFREVRNTAQATQSQVNTTQRSVDISANTAREQGEATNRSLELTNGAVAAGEKQANAAVNSADAAQTSAEATVEGAQIVAKGLYFGNRPFIGATDTAATDLEDGKEPVFTVILKNTGNTPARDVHAILQVDPRRDNLPRNPRYFNPNTRQSQSVITSGGVMKFSIPNGQPINEGGMATINAGAERIYIYGIVTYKDDLSTKCHVLRFCSLYNPKPKVRAFQSCEYYNREEDKPKCPKPN